jgi:hypothetical protein
VSRRTYAFRNGQLVELDNNYVPQPRIHLITDRAYEKLNPVITKLERDEKGNVEVQRRDISSRTKHRQYMKENGLALYDDFKGTWAQAEKQRADFTTGHQSDRDIREELAKQTYRVFDAPGIEERPKLADSEGDPALNPPGHEKYEPARDTSYPVVKEFLPHGK